MGGLIVALAGLLLSPVDLRAKLRDLRTYYVVWGMGTVRYRHVLHRSRGKPV